MDIKELTCIGCPMGCLLTVKIQDGIVQKVSGNNCANGDVYARKEVTNPTRIVTSTVVIKNGNKPRLSVKTKSDIPKDKIMEVMEKINDTVVNAPKNIGDVIINNVADTGVDVIATKNIKRVG
ncbi:DUF1667 domain-containing protein [Butyrivibrio sp. NC3005]|uniref:DUF1667 domain-containing protein n=1 Tax=Butyrivibrio sp. NC3005 TaxID=1280685 RepID=UPI0004283561|nr:DUF1667 domain-containing protein [Butyrivibrio sp. NC3005]